MPLYTYKCGTCGRELDQFNRIADRTHGPTCCGAAMAMQLSAPMVQMPGGFDVSYRCQITGEVVNSMRKRQYIMDKHDMVDARDLKDTWRKKEAEHKREIAEVRAAQAKIPEHVRKAAEAVARTPPERA